MHPEVQIREAFSCLREAETGNLNFPNLGDDSVPLTYFSSCLFTLQLERKRQGDAVFHQMAFGCFIDHSRTGMPATGGCINPGSYIRISFDDYPGSTGV